MPCSSSRCCSSASSIVSAIWSPYYKIRYHQAAGLIDTNNIGHQQMVSMSGTASGYQLPHLLNRDAGRPPFSSVLIIGAGSGNDVAAALAYGATHVDAVEIDPAINAIGRADHPNHPYQDPRVTVHIDDGRSFIRRTNRTYDLIVYALVDSLVLHSGYSSLRLESFLFTQEAFNEISAHLSPNGMFAVYNFFRQGWIIDRIDRMAAKSFSASPLVISLPYANYILPEEAQTGRVTFVLAGRETGLAPIRARFASDQYFWVNDRPVRNDSVNAYGPQATRDRRLSRRRLEADRARETRERRRCLAAIGRLAVPVSEGAAGAGAQRPQHDPARRPVDGAARPARAGPRAAAELADVLSRRRVHAARDQERRPHDAALRLHVAGQLDRLLRDPVDDPRQQPVRVVREAGRTSGRITRCWPAC